MFGFKSYSDILPHNFKPRHNFLTWGQIFTQLFYFTWFEKYSINISFVSFHVEVVLKIADGFFRDVVACEIFFECLQLSLAARVLDNFSKVFNFFGKTFDISFGLINFNELLGVPKLVVIIMISGKFIQRKFHILQFIFIFQHIFDLQSLKFGIFTCFFVEAFL